MPKKSPLEDVAITMQTERLADVKALAASLAPEVQTVGAKPTTKADLLALMYRNWANPEFRQAIFQMNPKTFTEKARAMVETLGHPILPPPPLLPVGMPPAPGSPMPGPGIGQMSPGQMPPEQAQQLAQQAMQGAGPMPPAGG